MDSDFRQDDGSGDGFDKELCAGNPPKSIRGASKADLLKIRRRFAGRRCPVPLAFIQAVQPFLIAGADNVAPDFH